MAVLALLPRRPSDQRRLLAVLAMAAAAVLYGTHVHRPRSLELAERRDRLERLEGGRASNAGSAARARLRRRIAARRRELAALSRPPPGRAGVVRMFETIARRSRTRGVSLVEVTPEPAEGPPQPADGPAAASVRRRTWAVRVEGPYRRVVRLLGEMASLGPLVRPSVRSMRPAVGSRGSGSGRPGGGPLALAADLTLEVLVPPDPPDAGAAAHRGEGPGGIARDSVPVPDPGRRDPFRRAMAPRPPAPARADLRLRLSGVLRDPDRGDVAVLVDPGSGRRHRLRVGDRIRGRRVLEIRADRVVFGVPSADGEGRRVVRLRRRDGGGR